MTARLVACVFLSGLIGVYFSLAPSVFRLLAEHVRVAENRARRTGKHHSQVLHPLVGAGTVVQFGKRR